MAQKQLGTSPSSGFDIATKSYVDAAVLDALDLTSNPWNLTVTTVKTSAYTTNPFELVSCDATSASFNVTLPAAPADNSQIIIKKIDTSANTVTVQRSASDVFNKSGGPTYLVLSIEGESVSLYYRTGIWYVIEHSTPYSTNVGKALVSAPTAIAARTAIGAIGVDETNQFAVTIGDGIATSIPITHNLSTLDVLVSVHRISTGKEVDCDVTKTDANTVTLDFAEAPEEDSLRCVVIGTAFGTGTPAPVNSSSITDSTVTGRALITATDAEAARSTIKATDSETVITAESLGIPCDGVTDAAPIINALPPETGIIHFAGTILCKTPLTIPHATTLMGNGRQHNVEGASVILFDNTVNWGSSPKLLTLGVGTNICFATRVVDAVIDAADIPESIAVYSKCANEQSGLYNVLIRRAVSKGVYVDGSLSPIAQNWGMENLEIIMSEDAGSGSIGIDVYGGGTNIRGINGVTVTNLTATHIAGMIGVRINSVHGGALRDCHFEWLETGVLIGDTHAVSAFTLNNIHGSNGLTDLVKIESPSVGAGNVHDINLDSLTGSSGGVTNIVNDVPRSGVYTHAANPACGFYRLGSGADASIPIDTNLIGAPSRIHVTTGKTTPVDADEIGLVDSAASWVLKKLTWANLKTAIASATMTLTNKTITSPRINAIKDTNGADALTFEATASAANYLYAKNSVSGSPLLRGAGSATDVGLALGTKGVANITTQDGTGAFIANFVPTASAVNYLRLLNAVSGSAATINATSATETNVNLDLTTKGSGVVKANGNQVNTFTTETLTTTKTFGAVSGNRYIVLISASGAPTLPTAAGNSSLYTFKNIHSADRTIATTSSQTIEGSTTLTLPPGDSVELISDGTGWRII